MNDNEIFGVVPRVPGTSVSVRELFNDIAAGRSLEAISGAFPDAPAGAMEAAIRKAGELYAQHARANDLTTIVPAIQNGLEMLEGVEIAFIFGSTARGEARPNSDIDLMLIGDALVPGEALMVFGWQCLVDHGRVVDVMTYTENEWRDGVAREGGFEQRVLQHPIVMLQGSIDQVATSARDRSTSAPSSKLPEGKAGFQALILDADRSELNGIDAALRRAARIATIKGAL